MQFARIKSLDYSSNQLISTSFYDKLGEYFDNASFKL